MAIMKSIIVTGATSMLGISLINRCMKENIKVLAITRMGSLRRNNIPTSPLITVVECDNDNLLSLNLVDGYDVFYHFGWRSTVHAQRNHPICQSVNIQDTLIAVQCAAKWKCTCFIGAGSQAEYGRSSEPISEDHVQNPESAYGISKYTAGRLASILCKQLGVRFIWARVFSVYGPHDGLDTMVSSVIRALSRNQSIDCTPAEQIWDYLYESDCAEALYLLGLKGKDQLIYNIGSGVGYPLKDYIRMIGFLLKKEHLIRIGAKAYEVDQMMFLQSDIRRLVNDTGFIPQYDFQRGIQAIIEAL